MQQERLSTGSDRPETVASGHQQQLDPMFFHTHSEKRLHEAPGANITTRSKNSSTAIYGKQTIRL